MGIFDRLKRRVKGSGDFAPFYPENIWSEWLSGDFTFSDGQIDPYKQIAVVYACVDKIATNISMTRWAIRQNDEDVENNNLVRLFEAPYPGVSGNRMWREIISNLELSGRAYLIFQEYIGSVPAMMWVPNSSLIKTVTGSDGKVTGYEYGRERKKISAEDVVFFNYYDPLQPYGGHSPLGSLKGEVDLQWYAQNYNIQFFKKGGMLKGFFNKRSPGRLSNEQQKELQRKIENAGGGYKNAHAMPVFNDLEWTPVGLPQKDIEFSKLMQETADRIYQAFGVPKSLFGFTDTTFNNMSEAKKHFWNQTLLPKMRNIESTLQEGFFKRFAPQYEGKFATWEIPELQVDLHTSATTAKVFYDMGVPFSVLNETMGLGFPEEIDLESRIPFNPFMEEGEEADAVAPLDVVSEEGTVQDAALNGAQVTSLIDILVQVTTGVLPISTARQMILSAFPLISEDDVDAMLRDIKPGSAAPDDKGKIYEEEKIRRRIEREKQTVFEFRLQKQDHVASIKIMDRYEQQMIPATKRVFNKISKEVHEWIVGQKQELTPEQLATLHHNVEAADWLKLFVAELNPIQRKVFFNGMRRTYWGMGVNFNLPPERALQYLAQRGILLQGTVDDVKDKIVEAMTEGKTSNEMAKEISKLIDDEKGYRSKRIARTETTAAYNNGRVEGMRELGIKKKMWINAGDDRVRDEHQINGEIQHRDDLFSNGQLFPGDGPASLVCNCRCTVGSVLE